MCVCVRERERLRYASDTVSAGDAASSPLPRSSEEGTAKMGIKTSVLKFPDESPFRAGAWKGLSPTPKVDFFAKVDRSGSKRSLDQTATERAGNNLNGFEDLRTENGSSQG